MKFLIESILAAVIGINAILLITAGIAFVRSGGRH